MVRLILVSIYTLLFFVGCSSDDNNNPVTDIPIKDPPKVYWQSLSKMKTQRQEIQPVLLNGKIYIVCGFNKDRNPTEVIEAYDIENNTWESVARYPAGLMHHVASASYNGKLYLIGGYKNPVNWVPQSFVYSFDPSTNTFEQKADIPTARGEHMAVTVGDKIYVVGGRGDGAVNLSSLEVYDPINNSWEKLKDMPTPRNSFGLSKLGNDIYVLGGRNTSSGTYITNGIAEVYNTNTNTWRTIKPVPEISGGTACATLDGAIYLIGGERLENSTSHNFVYKYNVNSDSWSLEAPMPANRHGSNGISYNGKIYIIGGAQEPGFGIVENQVNYVFTP